MRLNIALCASRNWLLYSATTVASILCNAKEDESHYFYILSNDFDEKEKNYFYSLNRIKDAHYHFIKVDDTEFDGAIHDWLGVSASYRLKLPSLVNEDKCLYLDSDIIALQTIRKLYSQDISDYYLVAVEDKSSTMMKTRVNLNENQTFFNSGMLLLNLRKFREDDLEKKIFEILRTNDYYTDQDVLNDVCKEKFLSLPLKYNLMHSTKGYSGREEEKEIALSNPVLYHFICKPWESTKVDRYNDWLKFRNMIIET